METYQRNLLDEQFRNAYPAKPGKRFVSFAFDMIFVTILSILLMLGGSTIVRNSSSYTEAGQKVAEEIAYYREYSEKTHLVKYNNEGTRIDTDEVVLDNALRAIYRSYIKVGNGNYSDYVINKDSKFYHDYGSEAMVMATYETDSVSYFYTEYIQNLQGSESHPRMIISFPGGSAEQYVINLYRNHFSDDLFSFDNDSMDLPTLKLYSAYSMYHYLSTKETADSDTVFDDGKKYYSSFYNTYKDFLEDGERLILQDEPYYSTHYLVYQEANYRQGRMMNIALVICILISYILLALVPKFIFRYERTFGKLIMGLGTIDKNGMSPLGYVTLLKSLLGFFPFLTSAIVLYLFPPFNAVYDAMMMPFLGEMPFALILFIVSLLGLINNVPLLFTSNRQSLLEMGFRQNVKDRRKQEPEAAEHSVSGRSF